MRYFGKMMFTLNIPFSMSNRNNGQGRSWHASAKDRKLAEKAMKQATVITPIEEDGDVMVGVPFEDACSGMVLSSPVTIIVTRVLGKGERKWDADSVLRGSCKQLIDAIVATGLLVDDGPKYVALVVGQQDDTRRSEGPFTEVTFVAVDNAID